MFAASLARVEPTFDGSLPEYSRDMGQPDGLVALDRRLVALCRQRGPLRAASILVPLLSCDPLGRFTEAWVAWAERVTVRRLREDVEWAVALEDTDPDEFRRTGGLPAEAGDERSAPDREIGAQRIGPAEATQQAGPAEVVRLFLTLPLIAIAGMAILPACRAPAGKAPSRTTSCRCRGTPSMSSSRWPIAIATATPSSRTSLNGPTGASA